MQRVIRVGRAMEKIGREALLNAHHVSVVLRRHLRGDVAAPKDNFGSPCGLRRMWQLAA